MTRFLRSILSNWAGMAFSMAVAFFMSPFLVHTLGDREYGLWVFMLSMTGYMGLLDVGLRVSVVKYVSQLSTLGDYTRLNQVVGTALAFYGAVAALIMVLTFGLELALPRLVTLDAAEVDTARLVLLLTGANVAATLVMSIPGGVLAGLQRYDLSSAAGIVTVIARTVGIVVFVKAGYGIVALGVVHLLSQFLFGALAWCVARYVRPDIKLSLRQASIETVRTLWNYSAFVLVNNAGRFLLFGTGEIVVGAFLGTAAVTHYAIAGAVAQYMQQLVVTMTQVLHPHAAALQAKGSTGGLRDSAILGTRMALVVGVPITVTVFVVGASFLALWMGPTYAAVAGPLLLVLTFARLVHLSQSGAYEVLLGMGKHRVPTLYNLAAGVLSLALGAALAPWFGLAGVVSGGAVAIVLCHGILLPRHVNHELAIPWSEYVRRALWPPVLAGLPYGAVLWAIARVVPIRSLLTLGAVVAAALPVFAVGAYFTCLDPVERDRLAQVLRRRKAAPAAPLGAPANDEVTQ